MKHADSATRNIDHRGFDLLRDTVHGTSDDALLTPTPSKPSVKACQAWAASQDEDAVEMWGALQSGGSAHDVGLMRLTLSCLGDELPEIVGFGSSAGFNEAYCAKHAEYGICRQEAERNRGAPACVVNDPTNTTMNYRTAPNGKILGPIGNGRPVSIVDTKIDANGKRWAFVSDGAGNDPGLGVSSLHSLRALTPGSIR